VIPDEYRQEWDQVLTDARQEEEDRNSGNAVPLIPNLVELRGGMDELRGDGSYYMGGVNNGHGLGMYLYSLLLE
jgi:hypothetical protein